VNRRRFFRALGLGVGALAVKPTTFAEMFSPFNPTPHFIVKYIGDHGVGWVKVDVDKNLIFTKESRNG
jgi:hypothetical protein